MFNALPEPNHALMQDPAFSAALRMIGQKPILLASGQIALHRRIAGIPLTMLPRTTPPENLRALLRAAHIPRGLVILSPESPSPIKGAIRLRAPIDRAELDLTQNEKIRRARLHGKWRNQLRRAENSDLRISHKNLQPTAKLMSQEAQQAKSRGYTNWPAGLTAAFATVAPGQTRHFTAYQDNSVIAQMLFLLHGNRATYHIGLTTEQGRKHHAHNLLLWQASNWLAAQEYQSLDLGLLPKMTPCLNRFKKRTGATIQPTGGTWITWA